MIIDKFTISILRNFAKINPSIFIEKGKILNTFKGKAIRATAVLDIVFPKSFALHDLWKFIRLLEMFKEPNVEFSDKMLVISAHGREASLRYTEEKLVDKCSSKTIVLPSVDALATIGCDVLPQVETALSHLALNHITVLGNGEEMLIGGMSNYGKTALSPRGDAFFASLGTTDKVFRAVFNAENLKLYPSIYEMTLCRHGLGKFQSERLTYYIAMDEELTIF
jgi:hypothetical protein